MDIKEQDILQGGSTNYLVQNFLGEGDFGKVMTCVDMKRQRFVAVKIQEYSNEAQMEEDMLREVNVVNPDKTNIIRFIESFRYRDMPCLVVEKLDMSLFDLLVQRPQGTLTLNEIRPISQQLLTALKLLQELKIIHTDIKADNVMLVNHREEPYRVKLIDFGLALPERHAGTGMIMQPEQVRAPEVTLGLPLTTAVDTWALGCLLTEMYCGGHIFPENEYSRIKTMIHLLQQPGDDLLLKGLYASNLFCLDGSWRMKTVEEYQEATGLKPEINEAYFTRFGNLDYELKRFRRTQDITARKDKEAFLNFVKRFLHVDYRQRITATDALSHSFITMDHLADKSSSIYAREAIERMYVTTTFNSDSEDDSFHDVPEYPSEDQDLSPGGETFFTACKISSGNSCVKEAVVHHNEETLAAPSAAGDRRHKDQRQHCQHCDQWHLLC